MTKWLNEYINEWMNESIDQSINPWINPSSNQSIHQSATIWHLRASHFRESRENHPPSETRGNSFAKQLITSKPPNMVLESKMNNENSQSADLCWSRVTIQSNSASIRSSARSCKRGCWTYTNRAAETEVANFETESFSSKPSAINSQPSSKWQKAGAVAFKPRTRSRMASGISRAVWASAVLEPWISGSESVGIPNDLNWKSIQKARQKKTLKKHPQPQENDMKSLPKWHENLFWHVPGKPFKHVCRSRSCWIFFLADLCRKRVLGRSISWGNLRGGSKQNVMVGITQKQNNFCCDISSH